MKSDKKLTTEEKVKKATNVLWKMWWFFVFLLIIPLAIAFLSFFIINFVIGALLTIYVVVGLTVIIFIFSILFFYRFYDRYRDNPIFFNQENNLTARIHIFYIITISSLAVTPIFVFITPLEFREQFQSLPLISFCLLYNIVYFYSSLKPIDYFTSSDRSFKRALKISLSLKQSHNYLIIINYFIQIIYLSSIYQTKISWLFALITNLIFYFITLSSTAKIRKSISNSIKKDVSFLDELTNFKQKFISSILGLDFTLLIQIPFVIILMNILQGQPYNIMEFINSGVYAFLVLFLYIKF
ncbi:MAG: hypothetical protein ACFFKA_06970, partial [Candidatus Thorarchaeota archaeon]